MGRKVLFALGLQRLAAVDMICSTRKRSWATDTAVCDEEQEPEPFFGLRLRRTNRVRHTRPWYLKLLCEERNTEPQREDVRSPDVLEAQAVGTDKVLIESTELSPEDTHGLIPKSRHTNGDGAPRLQALDHVLAKKLKSGKKSLPHHRNYHQPYYTDRGLIKKYKHDDA